MSSLAQQAIDGLRRLQLSDLPVDRRDCAICLEPLEDSGDHVPVQVSHRCSHVFGLRCIEAWVVDSRRNSCPNCRREIYEPARPLGRTTSRQSRPPQLPPQVPPQVPPQGLAQASRQRIHLDLEAGFDNLPGPVDDALLQTTPDPLILDIAEFDQSSIAENAAIVVSHATHHVWNRGVPGIPYERIVVFEDTAARIILDIIDHRETNGWTIAMFRDALNAAMTSFLNSEADRVTQGRWDEETILFRGQRAGSHFEWRRRDIACLLTAFINAILRILASVPHAGFELGPELYMFCVLNCDETNRRAFRLQVYWI